MKTPWMVLAALSSQLWAGTGPALAQSCEERAVDLAAEHQLSAAPPVPAGSGQADGDMSRELSRSGGVIAPPPTGDITTIEPPAAPSDGMPTAPPVDEAPSAEDAPARQPGDAAAANLQAETLIQNALSAAREGDEARCLERLAEAEQILAAR